MSAAISSSAITAPAQKTIGTPSNRKHSSSLIVVNARGAKLQGQTLTLEGISPSAIVFADPAAKRRLEAILHPLIGAEADRHLGRMQADDAAATRDWFHTHVEGDFAVTEGLAPVAHAFSHYKLELQPLRVRPVALRARVGDNDDLRWVARGELTSLGIPAPIRRLLTGA